MKPTNRHHLYVIVRTQVVNCNCFIGSADIEPVILNSYRTYERADEVKGCYEQQFIDADLEGMYTFQIQTSSFYDE